MRMIFAAAIVAIPLMAFGQPYGSNEPDITQQARDWADSFKTRIDEEIARDAVREPVIVRLAEACDRMFDRDADAAITNPLCFDLFPERGLPE